MENTFYSTSGDLPVCMWAVRPYYCRYWSPDKGVKLQTSSGWGWVLEAARMRGFEVAEAEHWRACSLLPFSAWREKKSSIVVMATDLESKGQQIWGSDLSPACWGGGGRDKAQGTGHVQKLRDQPQRRNVGQQPHVHFLLSLLLFMLNGACMKWLVLTFCWVRGYITVSYEKKFQLVSHHSIVVDDEVSKPLHGRSFHLFTL